MSIILLLSMLSFFSCDKKSSNNGPAEVVPLNLVVSAEVSADNSGNVSFTATATNAATYEYDFGNGVYQTVPTGKVSYRYPASGTYAVSVTAKSSTGKTL
ncbi:MAG TPA: PKD domain-containing protein, partial [Chitinophagaceae bacterium]